jgi:hypothetical protein
LIDASHAAGVRLESTQRRGGGVVKFRLKKHTFSQTVEAASESDDLEDTEADEHKHTKIKQICEHITSIQNEQSPFTRGDSERSRMDDRSPGIH